MSQARSPAVLPWGHPSSKASPTVLTKQGTGTPFWQCEVGTALQNAEATEGRGHLYIPLEERRGSQQLLKQGTSHVI